MIGFCLSSATHIDTAMCHQPVPQSLEEARIVTGLPLNFKIMYSWGVGCDGCCLASIVSRLYWYYKSSSCMSAGDLYLITLSLWNHTCFCNSQVFLLQQ